MQQQQQQHHQTSSKIPNKFSSIEVFRMKATTCMAWIKIHLTCTRTTLEVFYTHIIHHIHKIIS